MKPGALLPALLVAASAAHAQAPTSFDDCDRLVLRRPDVEDGYRCYVTIASRQNGWDEAAHRLESRAAVDPGNHLARLALASVEARRGGERAEALYVESIEAFAGRGNTDHEVSARLEYATFLAIRGRAAESGEQMERAAGAAGRSGEALLPAWVEVHLAQAEYYQARYEAAETRLMEIREVLLRDGSTYQQSKWYTAAGSARWGMARFAEAMQDFRQQADLLHSMGDPYEEAVARSNIALLASKLSPPPYTPEAEARIVGLVEEARATAVRGGNRVIEGKSELYLAQLTTDAQETRGHLQRGLALSGESGNLNDALLAYRLLSESLVWQEPRDPEQAAKLLHEAIGIAEASGSLQEVARNRIVLSNLHWRLLREGDAATGDRDDAIRLSLSALDAIEAIRDKQSGVTARARTFSPWVFVYSRFVGNLLWPAEAVPSPEDTDRAFRIAERMRARVFLDELDAADVARKPSDLPWSDLPGIARVRERLDEDEAVLSYITADLLMKDVFSGGSWLTLVTRNDVKVYGLPERTEIASVVDLTLGSIRNRDGSERAGLEQLYHDLLDAPLRELPDTVKHLIIVPDGPLHRLPFAALRQPQWDEPLGARYRISQVPSVAAWLHWTDTSAEPASRPALVWIDPDTGGADATAHNRDRKLGRLPYAALEARAARNHLGNRVRIRAAAAATEREFKRISLRDYGIIHVAAHAVVDDLHPDLSGIVLTAGGEEDGMLQVREIVDLDLDGRTVILSACRSASGATLDGEGVLSLARAFFVAGAQAVVANLWPVRDDEAAAFSTDLYRHLGEGQDLATALTSARRDRFVAGDPTEAWSGTVLFGNGRVAPVAGGFRRFPVSWPFLAVIAAVLATLRGITLYRRRVP